MARQKKLGNGFEVLLLIMFGALYFFAFIVPIVLIILLIIAEVSTLTASFRNAADQRFATEDEQVKLNKVSGFLLHAENEIVDLFKEGNANELMRRQYDHLFDGRSSLGRSLNEKIEHAYELKAKASALRRDILVSLEARQNIWTTRLSYLIVARTGVIVWFVTILVIAVVVPNWVIIPIDGHVPASLVLASILAAILGILAGYIKRNQCRTSLIIVEKDYYDDNRNPNTPMIAR